MERLEWLAGWPMGWLVDRCETVVVTGLGGCVENVDVVVGIGCRRVGSPGLREG